MDQPTRGRVYESRTARRAAERAQTRGYTSTAFTALSVLALLALVGVLVGVAAGPFWGFVAAAVVGVGVAAVATAHRRTGGQR